MLNGTGEQSLTSLLKESEVHSILSLTGERDSIFRLLCSWVTIRLRRNRYLFISDDNEFEKKLKTKLSSYTKQFQFTSYGDLVVADGRWARGCSVVLLYPNEAFQNEVFAGRIDGGIVRLAARGLWRNLAVTRAVSEPLAVRGFSELESMVKMTSSWFQGKGDSGSWLNELLLTLLYKRHLTVNKLLKEMMFCFWSQLNEVTENRIREALDGLVRLRVIRERVSQYTCTDYGRLLIERDISLKQFDLKALDTVLEQEKRFGQRERSIDIVPDAQVKEAILNAVSEGGWTSTHNMVSRLRTEYPALHSSPSIVRRLLEGLTDGGILTKGVYNRGVGRPINIYFEHGKEPSWLWDQCRGCAFYVRNLRRCRLWWSVDRFDRNTIHGQWDSLSPMAREKLRYGITGMGPKATACEHYAPRKRDFPIKLSRLA